jgi:hypothetical protein
MDTTTTFGHLSQIKVDRGGASLRPAARSFVQTLETGNRELSREKPESFLSASRNLCLRRAI